MPRYVTTLICKDTKRTREKLRRLDDFIILPSATQGSDPESPYGKEVILYWEFKKFQEASVFKEILRMICSLRNIPFRQIAFYDY